MTNLHTLQDQTRYRKSKKRVGRGIGSKLGKTCGRGEKGAGSRSGYKRRWGKEGGQMPLHMKLPIRGFNNARFRKELEVINLDQINKVFNEGDTVSLETLMQHGFISGKRVHGVKILGKGELSKNLKFCVTALSDTAKEKIEATKSTIELISKV